MAILFLIDFNSCCYVVSMTPAGVAREEAVGMYQPRVTRFCFKETKNGMGF